MIGQTLGHFRVVAKLGEGGMGEVYRARDTKLGRDVAVKVLPDDFAKDAARRTRFEREAKLLAQLNHANIATLHGLENHQERDFLVMELVEGETLAERIRRAAIPVDEAVPIFTQIARGLEAAHEQGIIHRDLKPANIKLTPNGDVKILDFGLAKAYESETVADDEASQSPTLTKGTGLGAILGTAAYMSPEQARGRPVDKRTDIWAFGCCLYEAVTGRKPFEGPTATDTIAAAIERQPNLASLPDRVRALVSRCLEKDAQLRLRDIGEARIALVREVADPAPTTGETPKRALALLIVGMVVASLAGWLLRPDAPSARLLRAELSLSGDLPTIGNRTATPFALSPDGETLAYVTDVDGVLRLKLRGLDSYVSTTLDGTDGAAAPFFSPRGDWLGFFAQGELKKVALSGGLPVTICEVSGVPLGASWGTDGRIVFASGTSSPLYQVDSDGGTPEVLIPVHREAGAMGYRWPAFNEHGVIYVAQKADTAVETLMYRFDTEESQVLVVGAFVGQYASTGHLIYGLADGFQTTLYAAPFDAARAELTGAGIPVLEHVHRVPGGGGSFFALSGEGSLVYLRDAGDNELVWVDRRGLVTPLTEERGDYHGPRLSPDGTSLAYQESYRVLIRDLVRGSSSFVADDGAMIVLRPRSRELAFMLTRFVDTRIFLAPIDGTSAPVQLIETELPQLPTSWTPDGATLIYTEIHPETGFDIWLLSDGEEPAPLLVTEHDERGGVVSPDGRYLAYVSDESGRLEIYVRPFPSGERRWIVSTEGGREPRWSSRGDELYYVSNSRMMAVEVGLSPVFEAGPPEALFDIGFSDDFASEYAPRYDVTPDGERFVMVRSHSENDRLHLIRNWFEELERLVPISR